MKYTIIAILTYISLTAAGQDNSNYLNLKKENKYKHEIGINLYNITEVKHDYYLTLNKKFFFNHSFVNGIMYKRHWGKNAIRVGFDYYYSKISKEVSSKYHSSKNEGKSDIGEFRIGYERKMTTSKLQPYFSIDLSITYGNVKGIYGGTNLGGWYAEHPYDIRVEELGIAPSIGLQYHAWDQFSFSIEINVSFVDYYHKSNNDSYLYEGVKIYYNPLRLLSVNYHF